MSAAAAQLRALRSASPVLDRGAALSYGAVESSDLEAAEPPAGFQKQQRQWYEFDKSRLLTIFGITLLCIAIIRLGPQKHFSAMAHRLDALPKVLSSSIMGVLIFLACILPLPVSLFQIGAGYLLGWWAVPLAVISINLGSLAAYELTRRCWYGATDTLMRLAPESAQIWIGAIFEGVRGSSALLIVTASRPAPLALSVQNLVLSVAGPDLWTVYVPGTAIGLLPENIIYPYIGRLVRGAKVADATDARWLMMVIELLVILLLLVVISIAARKTLKDQMDHVERREAQADANTFNLASRLKATHAAYPEAS